MAHPYKDKVRTDRERARHRDFGGRIPGMTDTQGWISNNPIMQQRQMSQRQMPVMPQRPMRQMPMMPQRPMQPQPGGVGMAMPQQAMPQMAQQPPAPTPIHGGVMKRGGRRLARGGKAQTPVDQQGDAEVRNLPDPSGRKPKGFWNESAGAVRRNKPPMPEIKEE